MYLDGNGRKIAVKDFVAGLKDDEKCASWLLTTRCMKREKGWAKNIRCNN